MPNNPSSFQQSIKPTGCIRLASRRTKNVPCSRLDLNSSWITDYTGFLSSRNSAFKFWSKLAELWNPSNCGSICACIWMSAKIGQEKLSKKSDRVIHAMTTYVCWRVELWSSAGKPRTFKGNGVTTNVMLTWFQHRKKKIVTLLCHLVLRHFLK